MNGPQRLIDLLGRVEAEWMKFKRNNIAPDTRHLCRP
jgi:hypothetical protein